MGDFAAKANGPNLNGCYLININRGGGVAGEVVIRQLIFSDRSGALRWVVGCRAQLQ